MVRYLNVCLLLKQLHCLGAHMNHLWVCMFEVALIAADLQA